jgi:hypothetical protein
MERQARGGSDVTKKKSTEEQGLVGFFGHTFTIDRGHKRIQYQFRRIQYQFRVVRAVPPDRWTVQLYSFVDGTPNKLTVYTESYLLSDDVALYPDAESWTEGYAKAEEQYRYESEGQRRHRTVAKSDDA